MSRTIKVGVFLGAMAALLLVPAFAQASFIGGKGGGGIGGGLGDLGKKLSDTGKKAGGAVSDAAKKTGGTVSDAAKKTGGKISDTAKKTGGKISSGTKKIGGKISSGTKKVGGKISSETKKIGGKVSKESKKVGGKVSNWWKKKVNAPIDAAWYRVFKKKWDAKTRRWGTTLEDIFINKPKKKIQQGEKKAVDLGSKVPQGYVVSDLTVRNLPGGSAKVTTDSYGLECLAVDAPKGGTVGGNIREEKEGKRVRIRIWYVVVEGKARVALGRNDGQIIATGSTSNKGFSGHSDLTTTIPVVKPNYKGVDAAHDYTALLQLDPGTKVMVYGMAVERVK